MRYPLRHLFFIVPWIVAGAVSAQGAQIDVSPNVHVSAQYRGIPHEEVDLRAHPTDPNRLIACGIFSRLEPSTDPQLRPWGVNVYTTSDGGKSWTWSLEVDGIDPTCAISREGVAYYVSLAGGNLIFYRSLDGGRHWLEPMVLPKVGVVDRQYVSVDDTDGRYAGTVYVTSWGRALPTERTATPSLLNLWRSTDRGTSFGVPAQRLAVPPRNLSPPTIPRIMADGTVLIGAIEVRDVNNEGWRCNSDKLNARFQLMFSRDGGQSLSEARPVAEVCSESNASVAPGDISLAVDATTGPFRDRIYAAWLDRRTGHYEVRVSWSADTGKTWSLPVVIDADRAAPYPKHDNFMVQLAVNKHGVVGVLWADRRDYADNLSYVYRFTASLDGGETWLPSVAVSSAPASWSKGEPFSLSPYWGLSYGVSIHKFTFTGGDTGGFDAAAHGRFHALWVDNRTGLPQMWTAAVRVDAVATPFGDPALASYRELREQVTMELTESRFDAARGVLTVTATLKNTSSESITGPFVIQVTRLSSPLATPSIANASNKKTGPGAIWHVKAARLEPGAQADRVLEFRLTGLRSVRSLPEFYIDPDLVSFAARILAPPAEVTRQESR